MGWGNNMLSASDFLQTIFGDATSDPIFLCSLPNDKGTSPGEQRVMTRDLVGEVAKFVSEWDGTGRGMYLCVSTLRPDAEPATTGGSPRNKANVSETAFLHADIDLKDVTIGIEEVVRRLNESLPLPPSIVVESGNGAHAYWLLKEAVTDEAERVEAALRLLADKAFNTRHELQLHLKSIIHGYPLGASVSEDGAAFSTVATGEKLRTAVSSDGRAQR
jgi:hypothetical protein